MVGVLNHFYFIVILIYSIALPCSDTQSGYLNFPPAPGKCVDLGDVRRRMFIIDFLCPWMSSPINHVSDVSTLENVRASRGKNLVNWFLLTTSGTSMRATSQQGPFNYHCCWRKALTPPHGVLYIPVAFCNRRSASIKPHYPWYSTVNRICPFDNRTCHFWTTLACAFFGLDPVVLHIHDYEDIDSIDSIYTYLYAHVCCTSPCLSHRQCQETHFSTSSPTT